MAKVKIGNKAHPFEIEDYRGNLIKLDDYKGKKVLISFFRAAACPFCNLRIHEMITRYDAFEGKNIEIITFFAATRSEIQRYAGKQQPPFVVIPDPEQSIYKKYGVQQSLMGMVRAMLRPKKMAEAIQGKFFNLKSVFEAPIIPADFIINENQHIVRYYYGSDYADHLDLNEVLI